MIAIGERSYEVDIERPGRLTRSLLIGGEQHEVVVRALGSGRYQVVAARGLCEVEVVDPLTHLARQARRSSRGGVAPRRSSTFGAATARARESA